MKERAHSEASAQKKMHSAEEAIGAINADPTYREDHQKNQYPPASFSPHISRGLSLVPSEKGLSSEASAEYFDNFVLVTIEPQGYETFFSPIIGATDHLCSGFDGPALILSFL